MAATSSLPKRRSRRYSARACNGNVPREVREGRKDERRLSELGGRRRVRHACLLLLDRRSAQGAFDRCVAKWPESNGKPYYLVATMAENMDWDLVKAPLQGFVDCFEGAKIKGFLKAGGVYEPGAVKKTKFKKAAFDLGTRI